MSNAAVAFVPLRSVVVLTVENSSLPDDVAAAG
jgi:hypothetical protein